MLVKDQNDRQENLIKGLKEVFNGMVA